MSEYIRLIETIHETHLSDFYMRYGVICAQTKTNEGLVVNLTNKSPALILMRSSMHDAMIAEMMGDRTQTGIIKRIVIQMRLAFKQNVRDIEKETNILGDATLPGKFAVEINNGRGPIVIPDMHAENTSIIGEFFIRTKFYPKVRFYLIECTQLAEDGTTVLITEKQMMYASDTLDGFVSGAKYLLRAKAVFGNTPNSAYTEYFEIRAN